MHPERGLSVRRVLAISLTIVCLGSCDADSSGAPEMISSSSSGSGSTAPPTTGGAVGTSVVADEGCPLVAPWALDAWASIGSDRGLVIQAHVVSADPPVNTTTKYGEYVTQRLNVESVDTIVSAGEIPADAHEIVVLVRPVDPAGGPAGLVAADDLVRGGEVIINAFTDADGPTVVSSAALVDPDDSVHFLGYCAEGSDETLALMMARLPSDDSRSERTVLIDWIRDSYGVSD